MYSIDMYYNTNKQDLSDPIEVVHSHGGLIHYGQALERNLSLRSNLVFNSQMLIL